MIATVCLYIAGTLYAVDGGRALPIGGGTVFIDRGETVQLLPIELGVHKFDPEQTLDQFLAQCDEQASRAVAEREGW